MTPCFAYLRVSTVRQGEGVSLQEQRAAIEDCAAKRGLNILEWFEEKETAAKIGRPVFDNMMCRLRSRHAKGLVVHKLDRSARNLRDWAAVTELMDDGIAFHIATEPIDFMTRGGRMTADFLAVIAADFSRNQREEVRKGLNGRLKQGLYPFKAPLGYLDNGKGKPKTPCPEKAPLVRQMFELYLSGAHSLRSLHAEMAIRGLRGHTGRSVSLHAVENMLSNTFYHGLITTSVTAQTFKGIHQPLITRAQYQRVQKIKAGRAGPKVTKHNHQFRGVFRCGLCGGPIVPERQKGHVYNRCPTRDCPMKTMRDEVLLKAVKAKIAEVELSPQVAVAMKARWDNGSALKALEKDRRSLVARIEATELKINRATDLLLEGTLDKPTYDIKKAELAFDLTALRQQLDNHPDPRNLKADREEYLARFTNLSRTFDAGTPCERRMLLKNVFAERTITPQGVKLVKAAWTGEPVPSTETAAPNALELRASPP